MLIFFLEWPDYSTESDTDSEHSEVEAIIGGVEGVDSHTPPHPGAPSSQPHISPEADQSSIYNSSNEDPTAQQIMSLLNELGHSNIVEESTQLEFSLFRCNNCIGRPQIV